jgi:predicted nucleic acid-binding protein
VGTERLEVALSVPLVLEYKEVAKRQLKSLVYSEQEIDAIISYLCSVCTQTPIFFSWRSYSPDPKDEKVLELAVSAGADVIVTFNVKNSKEAKTFGIAVQTPKQFLQSVGELP